MVQGSAPESLAAVLAASDAVQQRQVIQQLTRNLLPIMEKGILDPVLSHRCACCPGPALSHRLLRKCKQFLAIHF